MYILNTNENGHDFDVDETLVMWSPVEGQEPLIITHEQYSDIVYPNQLEIDSLKQAKVRGHHVTVHSQGGYQWAEAVVQALGLQDYVDVIKTKTKWYHDDLPADAWMTRIYHKPKMKG
jgi:FMN phosphatase YigB (HAD superfamily)